MPLASPSLRAKRATLSVPPLYIREFILLCCNALPLPRVFLPGQNPLAEKKEERDEKPNVDLGGIGCDR